MSVEAHKSTSAEIVGSAKYKRGVNPKDLAGAPPRGDHVDPFHGNHKLRSAYRHLQSAEWDRLETLLADDRTLATWFTTIVTSERVGVDPIAVALWERAKESPLARVIHARVRLRDAMSSHRRSYATELARVGRLPEADEHDVVIQYPSLIQSRPANERSDADRRLEQDLAVIEQTLLDIAVDFPNLPDPWVPLLVTGRGRGLDLEKIRDRFDRLHRLSPFHPEGCHEYLISLSKRWGGAVVATFDLCRWIEKQAPGDSSARMALPTAHLEQALLDHGRDGLRAYLTKPDVADELFAGLARFLDATPADASLDSLVTLNCYAATVTARDKESAELVMETWRRIAGRPTEWPWAIWSRDKIPGLFNYTSTNEIRSAKRF